MTSLVIGIPHMGSVKAATLLSVVGIVGTSKHPMRVAMQTGPFVHENRTKLVQMAQEVNASHLFFLDSDIGCPNDTLVRLLAHEKPIVGCVYHTRSLPKQSTVRMREATPLPEDLFVAQGVGTGCLLIDMEVFRHIDLPWFDLRRDAEGMVTTGEDVWFCEQAQKAGYDVWCDPSISVRHYGDFGF